LVRGFNDISYSPQSRHATCRYEDIVEHQELEVIAYSDEIGPTIVKSTNSKHFFVFGHPEYDRDTLKLEYDRDVAAGKPIEIPVNYYPDDDPEQRPVVTWRAEGQLIYSNWLNYYVYQTTPYDLTKI
jgi:homoserine O-succinyltransferase